MIDFDVNLKPLIDTWYVICTTNDEHITHGFLPANNSLSYNHMGGRKDPDLFTNEQDWLDFLMDNFEIDPYAEDEIPED